MANTYSAGIATAYGAAVRGGYTGTYDDFCRQQAEYAESAAAVEQAKEDAEAAATAAEGSKTAAAGSASAAAGSAGQASTSATNAANSATAANASKNAAATSAGNAENSATAAAGSAATAQNVLNSIPPSYDDLAGGVADLKEDLVNGNNYYEDRVEKGEYKLNWTVGKYIGQNGESGNYGSVSATLDYIPIRKGDILSIRCYAPGSLDAVAVYDTNKTLIEHFTSLGLVTYNVASDGFIRLSNEQGTYPNESCFIKVTNLNNLDALITSVNSGFANVDDKFDFLESSANETGSAQRTGYILTNVSIGSTVSTTVVADYGWYNAVIPVKAGEQYHITGVGGTDANLYALTNSSKVLLSKATAGATSANIAIAEDGYLIFNSRNSSTIGIYKTDTGGFASGIFSKLQKAEKTFSWSDKPQEPYFILSLDCAKKYFTISNIKKIIDEIAENGFNQLQIQLTTNKGFRLELDDMIITDVNGNSFDLTPCLGGDEAPTRWYSQAEMDDIISYAKAKGIDVYPLVEMPNHMGRILSSFSQFGDYTSLDLSNANAVNFAIALVDRYSKYFASRGCHFWNFGFDEQDFATAYTGRTFNEILDFGNKLIDLINANGLTPRMYNDAVLYNQDYMCQVKKNVEVMCWRYYTDQYATNIADFNEIQQAGYKIINSSAWLYYIDGSGLDIDINVLPTMDILKYWHGMSFYFNHLVSGAALSVWCDQSVTQNPGDGGNQVTSDILPIIDAFGDAIELSKLLHE